MTTTPENIEVQHHKVLEQLRAHGTAFGELGHQMGIQMGLHTTDSTALVAILDAQDEGAPLTQGQLSRRIGLTGGATSSLINRLEEAGHIRRVRNNKDRRIVTLYSTDGVEDMVDRFFDPLSERMESMMSEYSPETLKEFERFLADVTTTMNDYLGDISKRAETS